MNDHFQGNIYKCFAVRACGSDCVSECSWREVDCILFGMFNVEKKRQRLKSPLLPPGFHILSSTVWLPACSWAPSVFHHRPTKSESIIYWTQAHFFCVFSPLWRKKSKAVTDSETHCSGQGGSGGSESPLLSTLFPFSSNSLDPFFK